MKLLPTVCCVDLAKKPGFPGCCDSCHDDGDVCEWFSVDCEVRYYVCCHVRTWLQEAGKIDEN